MENKEENVVQTNEPVQTPVVQEKKGNKTLIIVLVVAFIVLVLIVAAVLIFVKAILPKLTEKVSEGTKQITEKTTTKEEKTPTKVDGKVSSKGAKEATKDSPVKIGEWALASKYVSSYQSKEYEGKNSVDVPVRITKVTRGKNAEKIVKDWIASQKYYKYQDPTAHTEWAVFEYQVDLTDVKIDEGSIGTSTKIDSGIKGSDGSTLKYDGISYILTTTDISGSDYVKEPGVYTGKFVATIPEGCTDYLIKMGNSYNGAESYIKGE